jgi:hypothetical protein
VSEYQYYEFLAIDLLVPKMWREAPDLVERR